MRYSLPAYGLLLALLLIGCESAPIAPAPLVLPPQPATLPGDAFLGVWDAVSMNGQPLPYRAADKRTYLWYTVTVERAESKFSYEFLDDNNKKWTSNSFPLLLALKGDTLQTLGNATGTPQMRYLLKDGNLVRLPYQNDKLTIVYRKR